MNPTPDHDEVRSALDRVTASSSFVRAERLCRFLRFVTDRTLEGRGDELKEYLLGVEVFEKGPDFDPRLDSAVRVDARRLRTKLSEYYASEGAADRVRITIPKGTYVPVFTWTGEPAPATVEEPREAVTATDPVTPPPVGRRAPVWIAWLVAPVVLAATGGGAWMLWDRYLAAPQAGSLAVLPFSNMTGQAGNDPLCDGLAEEMIDRLTRLPGVHVVSRSSAFAYKGKHTDVRHIARDLHVDSILQGSVREDRDLLRITVQLVRGSDGSHLWSESFDLMKGDELGVQTHIARTVEARLAATLPAGSGYRPEISDQDREINTLVIQAGYLVQRRAEPSLLRAIEYAERSVSARPSYAPAHAVLADAWLALADHRQGAERKQAVDTSRRHAREAMELNAALAGPLTTLGVIAMDYEWDWKGAEEMFRRAVRLNPNSGLAFARYARLLSLQGRHEEALEQGRRAETLTPLSVTAIVSAGHALFYARRYEDAIVYLNKALEIDPSYDNGRLTMAKCYGFLDRYDDAWKVADALSPAVRQSPEAAAMRAFLYGRQGRIAEARREVAQAATASSISLATALGALGDTAHAMRVLEEAAQSREQNVVYVKVSPGLDPLRRDSRIEGLCRQVGLTGCGGGR